MEISKAFYSIIVFSMIMAAAGLIITEWSIDYNSGVTSDLGELNKISLASTEAKSIQGKISPQTGEASSDFETDTFRAGYGILTSIFSPFRIVFGEDGMIDSVVERFGLPDYLWNGIIAMILFAIIFTIIAIIFRLGRTNV